MGNTELSAVNEGPSKVSSVSSENKEPDHFFVTPTDESLTEIVVLGKEGVGKSSILTRVRKFVENNDDLYFFPEQYVDGTFSETQEMSDNLRFFKKDDIVNNSLVARLKIYDTIGSEKWEDLKYYLSSMKAVIVVFDLSDNDSFETAKDYIKKIKVFKENGAHSKDSDLEEKIVEKKKDGGEDVDEEKIDFGLVMLGNKSDKENIEVTNEEVKEFVKENEVDFFKVSAKENINVTKAIHSVILQIYEES